jgi:hypothetical protein
MEFERTKMDVLGWNVLITSWLDPQSRTWKAGAPGITLATAGLNPQGCTSRGEAIARVKRELESHFRARAHSDGQLDAR